MTTKQPSLAPLPDLAQLPLPELLSYLMPTVDLAAVVTRALHEDLNEAGDVTTAVMVPQGTVAQATVRARATGIVAGIPVALEVLRQAAPGVRASGHVQDGERVEPEMVILSLNGPLAEILTAERTLLNFLGHMSGIATATARYVEAVSETRAVICDTRKTTPGLRNLEKYAVRCGGGVPHRMGLFDAVLVKDNHIVGMDPQTMASAVAHAAAEARTRWPLRFVMVECDTGAQFEALLALPAGAVDLALLDNMDPAEVRRAVNLRDHEGSAIRIEASGGVRIDSALELAKAGADRISVGAITHSAPCLDIGLDIDSGRGSAPDSAASNA